MSALTTQVGGDHYKSAKIQPVEYIEANGLPFLEGCVVKRVTRHAKPTGKGRQDIEKAIHELQLLLELRYPVGAPAALAFNETCPNIPGKCKWVIVPDAGGAQVRRCLSCGSDWPIAVAQ